jgi:DNA-binding winged helix-turn-helix (wHTH) protein
MTSFPTGLRDTLLSIVAFGRFQFDSTRHRLLADGRPVRLRGRPLEILAFLIAHAGRAVSHEEIIGHVWKGVLVGDQNLPVQVSILRRALRVYGADDLILTVPNQHGYRFVGTLIPVEPVAPVEAVAPAGAPQPQPQDVPPGVQPQGIAADDASSEWVKPPPGCLEKPAAAPHRRLDIANRAGLIVVPILIAAFGLHLPAGRLPAHVQVETKPDTIIMRTDGYCRVDYEFRVPDPIEMQLDTEDVRFYLTSGEPVSSQSIRGRIYHGSFSIRGPGTGIYHNNIYLPPPVVTAARANGMGSVYLRHMFHLTDPRGNEVNVPAVLLIEFGTATDACKAVK